MTGTPHPQEGVITSIVRRLDEKLRERLAESVGEDWHHHTLRWRFSHGEAWSLSICVSLERLCVLGGATQLSTGFSVKDAEVFAEVAVSRCGHLRQNGVLEWKRDWANPPVEGDEAILAIIASQLAPSR